jgi:hypothetical protein
LGNRDAPGHGAIVRVVWPRGLMDLAVHAIDPDQENIGKGMTWRRPVESL